MQKVYLDWNIITHLKDDKDENKELLDNIRKYSNFFIFPYSAAHLRDLRNGDEKSSGYKIDLQMLTEICGTHLLEYDSNFDSAYPYQCAPKEYLEKKGDEIRLFSSGFTEESFREFFNGLNFDFDIFLNEMSKIEAPLVNLPQIGVVKGSMRDVFGMLMQLGERYAKNKNIGKLIGSYLKETLSENEFNKIKMAKVDTIFDVLDEQTIPKVGKSFVDIIRDSLTDKRDSTLFTTLYLALDAVGFRTDKKRTFLNRYADAEHAYYASKCDVLVTEDSRLADKAQAIYKKLGYYTIVKKSADLGEYMEAIASRTYDFDYFFDVIAPRYAKPNREVGDLQYYSQMPFPFFGLFNLCQEIDLPKSKVNPLFLRIYLSQKGYVYYTEIERFFQKIEDFLYQDDIISFRKEYKDVFLSRNKERILKVRTTIDFGEFVMVLSADPDSDIPLPMMILMENKKTAVQNTLR